MSSVESEVQKASLAREILNIDDVSVINNVWLVIKGYQQERAVQDKPKPTTRLSDKFRGVFSKESADSFNEHIKTMREEEIKK